MSKMYRLPFSMQWTLCSRFEAVEPVCMTLHAVLAENGLEAENFALDLLLREAFSNAVKHGNRLDAKLLVMCSIRISKQRAEIDIKDQGAGFDPDAVQNAVPDDKIMESGRGLLIYRMYADEVLFKENANNVVLSRRFRNGKTAVPCRSEHDRPDAREKKAAEHEDVVRIAGNITGEGVETARNLLETAVRMRAGGGVLSIDMESVEILDSRGLGIILNTMTMLADSRASLRLFNVNEDVKSLLYAVNYHRFLTID